MRCFFAIFFDDHVKTVLADNQQLCRQQGIEGKYVDPDNIHLTLKFLGDITQDGVSRIEEKANNFEKFNPMKLQLGGLGVFPRRGQPRVLWQGLEGRDLDDLLSLHRKLDHFCARELGLGREKRAFRPHVTLLRKPSFLGTTGPLDLNALPVETTYVPVHAFSLIKSELTPKGPIYEELFRVPLSR